MKERELTSTGDPKATKVERRLEFMTRPEAERAYRQWRKAVLPIGATEQHGPHLPLGTDTFLAVEMAARLAERIDAIVLPALPVSYSWVWKDIPGTLWVSVELLKEWVKEIARNLARHGIDVLVLISGHGANQSALKYAVRDLAEEIPTRIFYFVYPALEKVAPRYATTPMWHGMVHACELETSWMLATRPDLCRMDQAVREYPEGLETQLYHFSSTPMGSLSRSGVFGDATAASAQRGEAMLQEMVAWMASLVERTTEDNSV